MTVGLFTFTLLDRFSAIHRSNSEDWVLEIRDTKVSDQGKIKYIYTLRRNKSHTIDEIVNENKLK